MQTILVTTDFSENALHATNVAIEIAKKYNATLILLHVYSLPIPNTDYPEMIDFTFYESIKQKQILKLKDSLSTQGQKIETVVLSGFSFTDEVKTFCENRKIDLIIMGLTGASRMDEILMGSNTMSMLTSNTVPILAVPLNFTVNETMKFAFAYDGGKLENKISVSILLSLVTQFNSKINAFHVSITNKESEMTQAIQKFLSADDFTMQTEINEDIDEGILEYITNNQIDILVLVHRKHTFFDRLFHQYHTREIARFSNVPLLVLPS